MATSLLLAAVLTGCASLPRGGPAVPDDVDAALWAAQTLSRLTLEQKVGQLIVARLPGGFANAHGATLRDARRVVREVGVGGFLVEPSGPLELAAKLNALQTASELPLLMAASYDGGAGGLLPQSRYVAGGASDGGTVFPGNMGIAATGQTLHAELAGRVVGREARAVGIHWLLAPVTAVAGPADARLLDAGAFSDDPATVSAFASAFVRGASSAGVLTTLRDFPGAGSPPVTAGALPLLKGSRAELDGRELRAVQGVLRAGGVAAVALGNVLAPAVTGDAQVPVSLSPAGIELLRGPLAFDGLVVTGPLDDPGLWRVPGYGPAEVVVRALAAGADVLLTPPDPELAQRAIVAAVRSGQLPYNRIDASVRRVLLAKARTGLAGQRLVPLDSVAAVVSAPEHRIVAAEIAAQSIVLARDSAALLPLDPRQVHHIALIAVTPPGDVDAGHALAAELRATYGTGTSFERLDARTADALVDAAVARAGLADAVVLAVFEPLVPGATAKPDVRGRSFPAAEPEHGAVTRSAERLAQRLAAVSRRLVVISFGDPIAPARLALGGTYMLAWQPHGADAQVAAARALSGRIPITGRLPVRLPRTAAALRLPAADHRLRRARAVDAGMDSVALDRIDAILLNAIHSGASPGAAIAVGRHGRIMKLRGYGRIDYRQDYADVTDSTIYDLASLTKVIGTTTALAMLVERGQLELDAPVGRYIPEWNTSPSKSQVTLRHLVLHNSGLAAYGPLYRELRGREEYRQRIARLDLTYAPGTRTLYSDFGIILLGLIIEQVTGRTLDAFLEQELFVPLGMRDTGFNPLDWPYAQMDLGRPDAGSMPPFVLNRIAPTELDTVSGLGQIHGVVHDENARALGGVAGHAGLFSSARDLAIFAQLLLDDGYYDGRRLLDPTTLAAFTARAGPETSRAIGWDTPSGQSSAGDYFSARSFGHTGFTGTSIWIDPERDLFVVLLTNRVNPTRENQKHVPLRRAVADAVQLAVRDVPVARRELLDLGTR